MSRVEKNASVDQRLSELQDDVRRSRRSNRGRRTLILAIVLLTVLIAIGGGIAIGIQRGIIAVPEAWQQ